MSGSGTARRTALVTGVSGQDGMYLARLLLARGWRVVGTVRPGISSLARMRPYLRGVEVVEHDLLDHDGFDHLLVDVSPWAVFNFAGFSAVGRSWSDPTLVLRTNTVAVAHMLESLLRLRDKTDREVRYFQASSAEMFGNAVSGCLGEDTPHAPRTPYAVSKSAAHELVVSYREHHDLFACSAILFNHESPFRGRQFVAGKIAHAAAVAACGGRAPVTLGDLGIHRDWGAAADYVDGVLRLVEHSEPLDVVLATGTTATLQDMLQIAFDVVGRDDWRDHVELATHLWGPLQARTLCGDPSRAREQLGWVASTSFETLVRQLVEVELRRLRTGVDEDEAYLEPSHVVEEENAGPLPA